MHIDIYKKCFYKEFKEYLNLSKEVWCQILDINKGKYAIAYTLNMQDYYQEYFADTINLSFTYCRDGQAVCIFAAFLHKIDDRYVISSDGQHLFEPLYDANISVATIKRINKKIYKFLNCFLSEIDIASYSNLCGGIKLSSWNEMILQHAYDDYNTYGYFVDLKLSIQEIRSAMRKSYKPLASKALRTWDYTIYEECTNGLIQEFRQLHFEVSGRATRSKKSWDIQAKQVNDNEGFIVLARDKGYLIGAALFLYNNTNATYAVAAYRRELFNKPIGHGVQMLAIEFLKEKGVKKYFIGNYHAPWEDDVSKKELAIEDFKRGFSTHSEVSTVFHIKVS